MSQQLCLFKFERPLVDRFGQEFFRAVPATPGIYLFIGARGRVLYVGQSKNLRTRLAYYKNARPEREPRKIIRLVHETRRIEVRRCDSPEAAQLQEVKVIQDRRPKFNTALTGSRTYSFFGVRRVAAGTGVRLSLVEDRREGEDWFGAFKNRGLCRRAFLTIGRILWAEQHQPESVYELPMWLNERARIAEWQVDGCGQDALDLADTFARGSDVLLARAQRLFDHCGEPFLRKVFEHDLLVLAEFMQLARRMSGLRELAGTQMLSQAEVDLAWLRHRLAPRE